MASATDTCNPKLRVAIIGGGIAGLTCAIALSHNQDANISVQLFESADVFAEIGAGLGIFLRPWRVLKRLGLEDDLKEFITIDLPDREDELRIAFQMRISNQPDAAKESEKHRMYIPTGNIPIHRVEFQKVLTNHLYRRSVDVQFKKRLTSYSVEKDNTVTLLFKDGSTASCDVLIGADGINSTTRRVMLGLAASDAGACGDKEHAHLLEELKTPVWSGVVAYRGLIDTKRLRELNPQHSAQFEPVNYMGKTKHVITFPVSAGKLINFVGFCSDPGPSKEGTFWNGPSMQLRPQSELAAQYAGWEPEVQQLIACVEKPNMWAVNTLRFPGMPLSTHGPVALMGDAAHAMTPHQGSGAGQAVEDAYVLAAILAHPLSARGTVGEALKVYERVRLPHANQVMKVSRENGLLYDFADKYEVQFDGVREKGEGELIKWIVGMIEKNWEWAWSTDIEDDKNRAIKLLEEEIVGVSPVSETSSSHTLVD